MHLLVASLFANVVMTWIVKLARFATSWQMLTMIIRCSVPLRCEVQESPASLEVNANLEAASDLFANVGTTTNVEPMKDVTSRE